MPISWFPASLAAVHSQRNGANFAVFVNTGQEFDGSDAGYATGTAPDMQGSPRRGSVMGKDSHGCPPRQGVSFTIAQ